MLVSPSQSHFKFERLDQSPVGSFDSLASLQPKANGVRKSAGSYHRRSVSCLAVASHHEHYEHPSYYAASGRYYDTIEVSEGSASPVNHTRHVQRKSEGQISIGQLQRSLSNAGLVNVSTAAADGKPKDGDYTMVSVPSGPLSGKLVKVNVASPTATPRRSLLSDLLNNQGAPTRLEQNANRRRMLKSMRRYSVDASEMNFSLGGPASRVSPMTSIPSEDSSESISSSSSSTSPMLIESRQTGFSATPTVRYLRNPCHTAIKTKLQPSAFRGTLQRRDENGERPDYFGGDDRVW